MAPRGGGRWPTQSAVPQPGHASYPVHPEHACSVRLAGRHRHTTRFPGGSAPVRGGSLGSQRACQARRARPLQEEVVATRRHAPPSCGRLKRVLVRRRLVTPNGCADRCKIGRRRLVGREGAVGHGRHDSTGRAGGSISRIAAGIVTVLRRMASVVEPRTTPIQMLAARGADTDVATRDRPVASVMVPPPHMIPPDLATAPTVRVFAVMLSLGSLGS